MPLAAWIINICSILQVILSTFYLLEESILHNVKNAHNINCSHRERIQRLRRWLRRVQILSLPQITANNILPDPVLLTPHSASERWWVFFVISSSKTGSRCIQISGIRCQGKEDEEKICFYLDRCLQ